MSQGRHLYSKVDIMLEYKNTEKVYCAGRV